MIVTVLEARVSGQHVPVLQDSYQKATQRLDQGIGETFLLNDARDPELWRIVTVWLDREALEAMRRSGETPRGVLIFREAGAEPALTVWNVIAHVGRREDSGD